MKSKINRKQILTPNNQYSLCSVLSTLLQNYLKWPSVISILLCVTVPNDADNWLNLTCLSQGWRVKTGEGEGGV